ncbi:hypothetical protein IB241_20185 [Pseudomonas sp. PDM05]|uniref:hypothetical protein n=1 Tax=Pseudomonas sp. PDM05 TaxID=2769301 RepID=UPI00177D91C1|nr:hypothetical protein [Pseudomonas sp. PDM05]MBD9460011.1 hypothetical protein [Pseudomonas sp. PDM05]
MTQWRTQGTSSKAWTYALLACLLLFTCFTGAIWPDGYTSNRKRVFTPGFLVVCTMVAVVELLVLNHFYGVR